MDMQTRNGTLTERIASVAISIGLALSITACTLPFSGGNDAGNNISGSVAATPDGTGDATVDGGDTSTTPTDFQSHNTTDNDKLAYYDVTSPDGQQTITSVIDITNNDKSPLDATEIIRHLNDIGIQWYQIINGKSTAGGQVESHAYVYIPSGFDYNAIVSTKDALTDAGYVVTNMTDADYETYRGQPYNLYYIETTYINPAYVNAS